jgi:DNA-binding transcriptional regulator YiaG
LDRKLHGADEMAQKKESVGREMADRLQRFTEKLDETTDLTEGFTCRTLRLNLKAQPYTPERVRNTRDMLHASQAIFAQFLGVSLSAVQDWEQGHKPPNGAACRMMDEIRRNPEYFRGRLRELS